MNKINVKYKLITYINNEDFTVKICNDFFNSEILFTHMIDVLIEKNSLNKEEICIPNLKTKTWGTIFFGDILSCIEGDNFCYEWLTYKLYDIQNKFKLFDNDIEIIINGPGIGAAVGEQEGIKFFINNNEHDRHKFEPHIHCKYSGEEMRIRIDTLQIMKKDKPFKNKQKVKKAIAWIKKNQTQLLKYYNSDTLNQVNSIKFVAEI